MTLGSEESEEEWTDTPETIRAAARGLVADQLATLVREGQAVGSREDFTETIKEIAQAQRSGDPLAVRAAVMSASLSAAQWATSIDLKGSGAIR